MSKAPTIRDLEFVPHWHDDGSTFISKSPMPDGSELSIVKGWPYHAAPDPDVYDIAVNEGDGPTITVFDGRRSMQLAETEADEFLVWLWEDMGLSQNTAVKSHTEGS